MVTIRWLYLLWQNLFSRQREDVCYNPPSIKEKSSPEFWNRDRQATSHGRPLPAEAIWMKKILSQALMKRKEREVREGAEDVGLKHSCFGRGTLTMELVCAGHTGHSCHTHPAQPSHLATAL